MKGIRALFGRRDFRLLTAGGFISGFGDWVLIGALPFYVYQRTGSALAAGTLLDGANCAGPRRWTSARRLHRVGGNRKRTLVVADVVRGFAVLACSA